MRARACRSSASLNKNASLATSAARLLVSIYEDAWPWSYCVYIYSTQHITSTPKPAAHRPTISSIHRGNPQSISSRSHLVARAGLGCPFPPLAASDGFNHAARLVRAHHPPLLSSCRTASPASQAIKLPRLALQASTRSSTMGRRYNGTERPSRTVGSSSPPSRWLPASPSPSGTSEAPSLSRQLSDVSCPESYGPSTPTSNLGSPGAYATYRSMSGSLGADARNGIAQGRAGSSYLRPPNTNPYYSSTATTFTPPGSIDWKRYRYIPGNDGGCWKLLPEYAALGCDPLIVPHQKPLSYSRQNASSSPSPSYFYTSSSSSPTGVGKGYDSQEVRWPCLAEGCTSKPFRRFADLQRHYSQVHFPSLSDGVYRCDYTNCSRKHESFGRKDHYRDHLREYHAEDICKRGTPIDDEWLRGRRTSAIWWRCSKCLIRVDLPTFPDYICPNPGCRAPCEEKRKQLRASRHR